MDSRFADHPAAAALREMTRQVDTLLAASEEMRQSLEAADAAGRVDAASRLHEAHWRNAELQVTLDAAEAIINHRTRERDEAVQRGDDLAAENRTLRAGIARLSAELETEQRHHEQAKAAARWMNSINVSRRAEMVALASNGHGRFGEQRED